MVDAVAARDPEAMIRVAIVDDHHAVRLGLEVMLGGEPDIEAVGAAAAAGEVWPLLYRTAPDVVIVDYRLPDADGLSLCQQIKAQTPAPALVLHSAFADDALTVAALVAGIDGVVNKGAPGRELAEAVRTVAQGERALPPIDQEVATAGAEVLDPEDVPILGMLVHGSSREEIARVLQVDHGGLRQRLDRMLAALRARPHEGGTSSQPPVWLTGARTT